MQGPQGDASPRDVGLSGRSLGRAGQRPCAWWFRPSVVRVEAAGSEPNRCRRPIAISAALPRVASDRLGLSHVGCDLQPTVPENGRFVALLPRASA